MDAIEKVADLIEQVQTDWRMRHPENDLPLADTTARALIAAFPQLALEGHEEWGDALNARYPTTEAEREFATHKRTVWESPWSEVQS